MTGLVVAAGGGGDAITAALLPTLVPLASPTPVLTYSWDRLLIDPLPGPRAAADFTGLVELAPNVLEITGDTRPVKPAGSSLPRLARELPVRPLLMDASNGAVGLAGQIRAAARFFAADHVYVLDVGGDILTDGQDRGLRSPLADQLALAAVLLSGLPSSVVVAGVGLDGEIDPVILQQRMTALRGEQLGEPSVEAILRSRSIFRWHPSEASGMLAAAAAGARGRVQVRDKGDIVVLDDDTPQFHVLPSDQVAALAPASKMTETQSLQDAEELALNLTGVNELAYERRKAGQREDSQALEPPIFDLARIDAAATAAAAAGADYLSVRRLAELLSIRSQDDFEQLGELLATNRPEQCHFSIYGTG